MKALLLSGGTGSRLRPLTYTGAKQLIPVANKPILFYAIEAIRDAGVTDFGIIVGDTKNEIKAAVGDGSQWGITVTYIEQDAPRGLAHAVGIAEEFIGDEPFIMFLGDNLVKDGVEQFVRTFKAEQPNALILLSRVPEPQRFGVAELQDGRIVRLVEKPKIPPSDLALVGVYLFDHHIFRAVKEIKPSWRNELEITDAIQWLVETGHTVTPYIIRNWWKDTGKPEDVLDANRLMMESIEGTVEGEVAGSEVSGRVAVGRGARVINSVVRGPVIIGEDCLIKDAYIGPYTAIGNAVSIVESEIENSIVLEGSSITNAGSRIDQSLIGKNVTIVGREARPRVTRLVLGDNSWAGLG